MHTQSARTQKDNLMFVEEVAARLHRSTDQLRWMIRVGSAPKHAKIAGRIVFREGDVEAYIDAAFAEAS